jgi:TATA-box binding protein (TBP) (component of TFIID and TFIIIB)
VSKDNGHARQNMNNAIIKRSILTDEKKKRKQKKKGFYNQVSMYVYIGSINREFVHVKLFSNGSVQMTGCQSVEDILKTIVCLMKALHVPKVVIEDGVLEAKPFVNNIEYLELKNICRFGISMINTNFKINFNISLSKLSALLENIDINCHFDKANHSCVNIKYDHPEKKISIFVFEKGSIVITGAKTGEQVAVGFNFINKFLYTNYKNIVKKEITEK